MRNGREVFTAYVPGGRGGDFMTLIEKTFGKEVTTRTWETVIKVGGSNPGSTDFRRATSSRGVSLA
jgi:hypothetical protein